MRAGLALVVLILNVAAILSILGTPARFGRKLAWTAAVVLLPVIGAAAWLVSARRRQRGPSSILNGGTNDGYDGSGRR